MNSFVKLVLVTFASTSFSACGLLSPSPQSQLIDKYGYNPNLASVWALSAAPGYISNFSYRLEPKLKDKKAFISVGCDEGMVDINLNYSEVSIDKESFKNLKPKDDCIEGPQERVFKEEYTSKLLSIRKYKIDNRRLYLYGYFGGRVLDFTKIDE